MFLYDMLLAITLAILLVAILMPARRYPESDSAVAMLFFFLLLFPLIWVAGAWLTPIGPAWGGVSWLGFIIAAFFLLVLLLLLVPPAGPREGPRQVPAEELPESRGVPGAAVAFGAFFWLLLIAALIALFARYG